MGCVRSSPTRGHRAGALLTHRTAVPAVVATPRPEPARRNERSPFPAPDRTAVTAELHGGTRPHVPREKLRTTILPARLPRHPAVHPLPGAADRVLGQPHERPDGAPALVPLLLPGTGPGPPRRDPVPHLARRQCGTSQRPRQARPVTAKTAQTSRLQPRWSRPPLPGRTSACPATTTGRSSNLKL